MSSFFTLQPHPTPASASQSRLALPTLDPQSHHAAFPSIPLLIPYPTDGISPLHSYLHHSTSESINPPRPQPIEVTGRAVPPAYVPNRPTGAPNGRSAAPGASRPRKTTSSVSKATKPKKPAVEDSKSPCIQGIQLQTLPYPLYWKDISQLGPIILGPDPQYLFQKRFSKGISPTPHWLDFVLGAMMSRRCKNPWEVTVTIAELQPWRVWKTRTGDTWPEKLKSAYDQVSQVISRARPRPRKDAEGYFHVTDPSTYKLAQRIDKNKPKNQRRTVIYNEEGTAVAPSPTSTPFLSPVTTGTSHSSVTTGPPTPAFQNSVSDQVDISQLDLFGLNDVQSSDGQTSALQAISRSRLDHPVYLPTPALSISTAVQTHTPAVTLGSSGHSQYVNTPIITFDQGYYMGSLTQSAPQAPTTSYQSSYEQVSGMDTSLGAASMTPLGAAFSSFSPDFDFVLAGQPVNDASGEGFDELAFHQWHNTCMDQFTYRS